jgi:RNA polymerase sigma factor (sigma-70 family)
VAISGELPFPVETVNGGARDRGRGDTGQVNTLVDLYRRHQQRIYRYCLALLRNPDDAEDATQETFTRAAPFLPNLPGDLSAYLTTVARNICCDVVRARARRSVPIDNIPLADRKVSPERQSVDWDVVRRMWRQLSPAERQLFAYTFAGYKYEEIASRTGMSRPSVSVGLARARRRLRDLATATGTLALLPLGIRRMLERLARRTNATLSTAQATVAGLADQVGVVLAGLVSGLFVLSSTTPAQPAMAVASVARHGAGTGPVVAGVQLGAQSAATGAVHLASGAQPPTRHRAGAATPQLPVPTSLVPGDGATPFDTGVFSVAASPNYPSDHTLFISGAIVRKGCLGQGPTCQGLFRSRDGGADWTRLTPPGYEEGPILLPPTFPTDPAIFMLVPGVGLEESADGGNTITGTIPGVTAASIAPWSPPGQDEIAALTGNSVAIYAAGATAPTSTAVLPAGFSAYGGQIAFTAPGSVAVAGTVPSAASGVVGAVTLCPLSGACAPPVLLPGSSSWPTALATSPKVASDHLVAALYGTGTYVSRDGGASFALALTPPTDAAFQTLSVGEGPSGPRIVVSSAWMVDQPVVVWMSDTLGQSFTDITGNLGATSDLVGTAEYPDGTIVAALMADATNHFALRQSTGNATWIGTF